MMRTFTRVARRLANASAHEIWTRLTQRAATVAECAIGAERLNSASNRLQGRSGRAGRPAAAFFHGAVDARATASCLDQVAPAARMRVLEAATRISCGEVSILGHGWVSVGQPPLWHREPIAGIISPRRHWSRIDFLNPGVVGDHKVLWEFNRHQYLVTLAQAWAYTGDPTWADVLALHLRCWMTENPPGEGVNWASSLEVAYRAISWCWVISIMGGGAVLPPELRAAMQRSLEAHGHHIARHLSTYFSPNTHLTGEALGLFYLGTTMPQLPRAAEWRALGSAILDDQCVIQILSDGGYFEQATQYQRYTAEIYLHYLLLAQASGWTVDGRVENALARLIDQLVMLRRPDGSMPLLGDDDGGRLIQLDGDRPEMLDGLICAAAVALGRMEWLAGVQTRPEMLAWLLGETEASRLASLPQGEDSPATSVSYGDSGLVVIREAKAQGHAVLDAGPHGALSGGHSHADALSMVLFAGGGDLLVDPGTFAYVGAERDEFRGIAAHNTFQLGQQHSSRPASAFQWETAVDARLIGWAAEGGATFIFGSHDGFSAASGLARHKRVLMHPEDGLWVIDDSVEMDGTMDGTVRWHFAPTISARLAESWPGGTRLDLERSGRLVAYLFMVAAEGSVRIEDGWVSPQYGIRTPSKVCVWNGPCSRNVTVRSIVIDVTACGVGGLIVGTDPRGSTHHVTIGSTSLPRGFIAFPGSPVRYLDVQAEAQCIFVAALDGAAASRVAAHTVRSLQLGLDTAAPELVDIQWLSATRAHDGWHVCRGHVPQAN